MTYTWMVLKHIVDFDAESRQNGNVADWTEKEPLDVLGGEITPEVVGRAYGPGRYLLILLGVGQGRVVEMEIEETTIYTRKSRDEVAAA